MTKGVKRLNIESVDGPVVSGALDQFRTFTGKFQVDYGQPFPIKTGRFAVVMGEQQFFNLSTPIVAGQQDVLHVLGRLYYLLEREIEESLLIDPENLQLEFHLTNDQVDELMAIDPNRIDRGGWRDLGDIAVKHIFVSCGQQTDQEKRLGSGIIHLVEDLTDFDGYFAEYQDSMEGVTENIFRALQGAAGFVAVMHKRDQLANEDDIYRGSVWIEQEIAIAAFLAQVQGKAIPSRVYVEKGVRRDGVRGYIIHNAIPFEQDEEVLEDVREWLRKLQAKSKKIAKDIGRELGDSVSVAYPKIVDFVLDSNPASDWKVTRNDFKDVAVFTRDINLRIEHSHEASGIHSNDFREGWANQFPDPYAHSLYYDIYYGMSLLDQIVLVAVDGGRAVLPLPKTQTDLQVSKFAYQVAKIFDNFNTVDEYIQKAGLTIKLVS